jgi:transcription factor C subunit 3
MGNRANHFVCYAYELPLKTENNAEEGNSPVDYVKSIIKANIMTDAASYNSMEAFALIHAQPEDAVDEAFFELSNNKVIAHRKEHNRVAPGRNYELTDKFHLSLRTPMDEKLFAQALKFDDTLQKMFEQKDALELSPFLNDGSVACIFDLVAHRRVYTPTQSSKF